MKIRGLLLDVEGVLVADKRYTAVATAVDFIRSVRTTKCPFRLISNTTTDDRASIIEKLTQAGFDFTAGELHTCTTAAILRLRGQGRAPLPGARKRDPSPHLSGSGLRGRR